MLSKIDKIKDIVNEIKDIWTNGNQLLALLEFQVEIDDDLLDEIIKSIQTSINETNDFKKLNTLKKQKERLEKLRQIELKEKNEDEKQLQNLQDLLNTI